jgi:hypothetical protein
MPPPLDSHNSPFPVSKKASGILSVLFFICVILVGAVPWLLLCFLVLCLVFPVVKYETVRLAFTTAPPPQITEDQRVQISVFYFFTALVPTVYACFSKGGVLPCWLASFAWLGMAHITQKRLQVAAKTKSFLYSLSSAAVEFFAIISTALTGYLAFIVWARSLPLNHATQFHLQQIEKHILSVHEHLDALDPAKRLTVLIVLVLVVVRILLGGQRTAVRVINSAWKVVGVVSLWLDRLALASLVLASFTVLATRAGGPPSRLEARIRDTKHNYTELHNRVQQALVIEIKLQLVKQAWMQRPQPLKEAFAQVPSILVQRDALYKETTWARQHYDMDNSESVVDAENAKAPPPPPPPPSSPSRPDVVDTTAAGPYNAPTILSAAEKAPEDTTEIQKDAETLHDDMNEDLMQNVQAYVLDADRLIEPSPFLHMLTQRYPLLDAFVDPINDAFNDYIFSRLSPIVDRLVSQKLAAHGASLVDSIRTEARKLVQSSSLRWHPVTMSDAEWNSQLHSELVVAQKGLGEASAQLEKDAEQGEERSFEKMVKETQTNIQELDNLEKVPGLEGDLSSDAKVVLARIEALPPNPHPLSGVGHPSSSVQQLLQNKPVSLTDSGTEIQQPVKTIPVPPLIPGHGTTQFPHSFPTLTAQSVPRPKPIAPVAPRLDQIDALNDECHARILKAIAAPAVDHDALELAILSDEVQNLQQLLAGVKGTQPSIDFHPETHEPISRPELPDMTIPTAVLREGDEDAGLFDVVRDILEVAKL